MKVVLAFFCLLFSLALNQTLGNTTTSVTDTAKTTTTEKPPSQWSDEHSNAGMRIFQGIGCTIGLTGNILVLITIVKTKELHNPSYYLVANLAVTDTWTSTVIFFNDVLLQNMPLPKNRVGAAICHLWESEYFTWVPMLVTSFTMSVIALDRYLAVAKPIFYRTKFNAKFVGGILFIVWAIMALYMQYVIWIMRFNTDNGKCHFMDPKEYNWEAHEIFWSLLVFHIPASITFGLYIAAYIKLKKKAKSTETINKTQLRAMRKIFNFCLIVMLFYTICYGTAWTMYLVAYIPNAWPTYFEDGGWDATMLLSVMNSWINPCIYSLTNKKFRAGLLNLVTCGKLAFGNATVASTTAKATAIKKAETSVAPSITRQAAE